MTTQANTDAAREAVERATGTGIEVAPPAGSLRAMLEATQSEIARALPNALDPARFVRIVQTELRKTPELMECTPASFLGAVLTAAQLGLEFGPTGRAYMLPFRNNKTNQKECQLIIGYRGWLDLIYRSGSVKSITARMVRANDHFFYAFGLDERLEHRPAEGERGNPAYYYCVAKTTQGGVIFDVMSEAEMIAHMKRYAPKNRKGEIVGPWRDNPEAMGLKTVFKRVYTWLPNSTDNLGQLARAVDDTVIHRATLDDAPDTHYPTSEDEVVEGEIVNTEGNEEDRSQDPADYDADDPARPFA